MSESEKSGTTDKERSRAIIPRRPRMDDIFENFRREMESMFSPLLPYSFADWRIPLGLDVIGEERVPLCDMIDQGDKYEVKLEVPGIEKEKVNVRATKNSLHISGEQSERTEDKGKNYVYNERSYRSFSRRIPIPEEIVPSKITAKMNNGILVVDLPKTTPTKPTEETTKVEIK
jgi:HSP20 family protein